MRIFSGSTDFSGLGVKFGHPCNSSRTEEKFRGGNLLMVSVGVIGLCYDLGSCSVCVLNVKSEP